MVKVEDIHKPRQKSISNQSARFREQHDRPAFRRSRLPMAMTPRSRSKNRNRSLKKLSA